MSVKEAHDRYRLAHKPELRARNQRYRAKKVALMRQLKSAPCTDCGGTFPSCAMDFDHVRGTKVRNVAVLTGNGGIPALMAEIAKCELVCANCHRIRTQSRMEAA